LILTTFLDEFTHDGDDYIATNFLDDRNANDHLALAKTQSELHDYMRERMNVNDGKREIFPLPSINNYVCPICKKRGFAELELVQHVLIYHEKEQPNARVVCNPSLLISNDKYLL
jgi:hypothetical protein